MVTLWPISSYQLKLFLFSFIIITTAIHIIIWIIIIIIIIITVIIIINDIDKQTTKIFCSWSYSRKSSLLPLWQRELTMYNHTLVSTLGLDSGLHSPQIICNFISRPSYSDFIYVYMWETAACNSLDDRDTPYLLGTYWPRSFGIKVITLYGFMY